MNKLSTLRRLSLVASELRMMRDHQEAIPCSDKVDICNDFDQIIDKVEALQHKIKVEGVD